MQQATKIIRYVLIAVLILSLFGLLGWYFFIHARTKEIASLDQARGYGSETPTANSSGSTYQNISNSGDSSSPAATNPSDQNPDITSQNNQGSGVTRQPSRDFTQDESATGTTSALARAANSGPRLIHAVKTPVAGFGFIQTATSTKLYYAERATGYVFSLDVQTNATMRLTNTLTPKVYAALFAQDGSVIERSLDSVGKILSFSGTSTKPQSDGMPRSLSGASLDRDIVSIDANKSAKTIFFIETSNTGTTGYTSKWDGSKKKLAFASPVGSWQPFSLSDGRLYISQNADDHIPGYAYEVKDSILVPIVRNIPGLTFLPSVTGAYIYGSSDNGLTLFVKSKDATSPAKLPLQTIADKCVWVPGAKPIAYCAVPRITPIGNFLDNWYRGIDHTSDSWWKVDATTGTSEAFYNPQDASVDVVSPQIDSASKYIAYKDAKDQSLWVLRISP